MADKFDVKGAFAALDSLDAKAIGPFLAEGQSSLSLFLSTNGLADSTQKGPGKPEVKGKAAIIDTIAKTMGAFSTFRHFGLVSKIVDDTIYVEGSFQVTLKHNGQEMQAVCFISKIVVNEKQEASYMRTWLDVSSS